ncbi:Potassium uptake protein TrkH [Caenispirillum salinarum AK4]|uniref:Trk system potassium uptake protein n=1 Tax=Caenispirillum salinarum AK4 TaxID=1238182 RepID=K9HRI8_9PROT|nr:TrkH family potassium uptake protein [Caenispirillum salinarum]EKV32913.1 Potassium uptake protein TrkH [Caenispirillum salinarum AK4]
MQTLTLQPVLYVLGLLVSVLGAAMVVPGVADLAAGDVDWIGFFVGAGVTTLVGGLLVLTNRTRDLSLTLRQAFLLTALGWIGTAAFSAVPFFFSRLDLSYTDAFFEAISGLTTTGSTILTGLDTAPPGILVWRSVLQWLGGIGIIVMAIVLLPFLRVGGMQLFRMESSDRSEKAVAKVGHLGLLIVVTYISMTVACGVLYALAGMTPFEAINHAMTTVSTGGYSTSDASMGHWQSPAIHWIGTVFMVAGAVPFVLYLKMARNGVRPLFTDAQVGAFLAFLALVSVFLAGWLVIVDKVPAFEALTLAAFNVTSVVTTTGYATADYTLWGAFAVAAFFALTFVGGCTGSTAGGIKIFRFQVSWRLFSVHLRRLQSPHAVVPRVYNDAPITDEVAVSVLLFFFVYVGTVGSIALLLGLLGLDWVTAISGAATAVSNVGPGLGAIIGPAGNFATLPDAAKWLLSAGMLLGRLEFFTVLVLLSPRFWKG